MPESGRLHAGPHRTWCRSPIVADHPLSADGRRRGRWPLASTTESTTFPTRSARGCGHNAHPARADRRTTGTHPGRTGDDGHLRPAASPHREGAPTRPTRATSARPSLDRAAHAAHFRQLGHGLATRPSCHVPTAVGHPSRRPVAAHGAHGHTHSTSSQRAGENWTLRGRPATTREDDRQGHIWRAARTNRD